MQVHITGSIGCYTKVEDQRGMKGAQGNDVCASKNHRCFITPKSTCEKTSATPKIKHNFVPFFSSLLVMIMKLIY